MDDLVELITGGGLRLLRADGAGALEVGAADWFAWLAAARRFVIVAASGRITVRKERAGSGHGRWYWRAYLKRRGALRRVYLGGDADLSASRLIAAVRELTAEPPPAPRRPAGAIGSEGGATPNILDTKIAPPALRPGLVARPGLVERLKQRAAGRLTLLTAPAGFGKTTLLAQSLAGADAAWLTLDRSDDDLLRLLPAMITAIHAVRPGALRGLSAMLRRSGRLELSALLGQIFHGLLALDRPLTLVIDDYHNLRDPAAQQLLAALAAQLPPHLHLLIASRVEPALPLARLRAAGAIVELTVDDLRLSVSEVRDLVRLTGGRALGEREASVLAARTEGWAAGLQLAALALRGQPDPARFIADFAGTHRFIMDYLIDEVLQHQPARLRRFLIETSLLDRLCGPLCDALLGESVEPGYGQRALEEIERRGLFLIPLDAERRWYRYHQLFGEVLRAELRREAGVEHMAVLRRRAEAWYAAQRPAAPVAVEPLTQREREVLALIAAGASNAAIAADLVIAVSTVKSHVNRLFGKLGVTSRTQALARGRELGLL